ncbi:MAG: tRNA preQ1(34) S-adenosylmethionine ribosyltransferase-isomerase QueA, partial [Actinobacteria bacterium]|nr:tRNA preQ1(34) S-adenosylmethionine ribosyltransferase-isomerase QueA [Actinomycetota bacterium]
NESRVVKCRLAGLKEKTSAKIECFVLRQVMLPGISNVCQVLLKPAKRIKENDRVNIGEFYFEVIEKQHYGNAIVRFSDSADKIMEKYGKIPLPPYIKNKSIEEERYQTVYAAKNGSAAAPTAGFHFTDEIFSALKKKGIKFAKICLDIGLDTFRPISEPDIKKHIIHKENYSVSEKEAEKINYAKKYGGRIIAVGTTTTRVLETIASRDGIIKGGNGVTGLYIYPGYRFRIVDAMLTNFHLPGSTLIVMVSAFAGREEILNAYRQAKSNNYRFYSFGDCMLII